MLFSRWEFLQYMNSKTSVHTALTSLVSWVLGYGILAPQNTLDMKKTLKFSSCRILSWGISSQHSLAPWNTSTDLDHLALWHHVEWQLCIRVTGRYIRSIISIQVACIFCFVVGADLWLLGLYYINTGQHDSSINIQTVYMTTTHNYFVRIVATK
jgi:hypothetical protein